MLVFSGLFCGQQFTYCRLVQFSAFEYLFYIVCIQCFVFEQGLADILQLIAVFFQQMFGVLIILIYYFYDFLIYCLSCFLRIFLLFYHIGFLLGIGTVADRSDFFAHSPCQNHLPGYSGGLLYVGLGSA